MIKLKYAVAATFLAAASPALAQNTFEGAGQTVELDCDGGTAVIYGASNTVTVTGNCTQLTIEGASNEVRVELAPKGVIAITGASNTVVWTTPDGSRAQVRLVGAANRVSMAK